MAYSNDFFNDVSARRAQETEGRKQRAADNSKSSFLRRSFRRLKNRDPEAALKFMDQLDELGRPVGATQSADQNVNSAQGAVAGRAALAGILKQGLTPPKTAVPVTAPQVPGVGATPPTSGAPVPPETVGAPVPRKPGTIDGMPASEWLGKFGSKPEPIANQIFDTQLRVSQAEQQGMPAGAVPTPPRTVMPEYDKNGQIIRGKARQTNSRQALRKTLGLK